MRVGRISPWKYYVKYVLVNIENFIILSTRDAKTLGKYLPNQFGLSGKINDTRKLLYIMYTQEQNNCNSNKK